MSLYFFDFFDNGRYILDEVGIELERDEVRTQAMSTLPAVAANQVLKDGDQQTFKVLVKNEAGEAVYSATLTYAGVWLGRDGDPKEEAA